MDEHVLVVRSIEHSDEARLGKRSANPPQEVAILLRCRRSLEALDPHALRVNSAHHVTHNSALAGRVHALDHEKDAAAIFLVAMLGPQSLLELTEVRAAGGEDCFAVLLVAAKLEPRLRRELAHGSEALEVERELVPAWARVNIGTVLDDVECSITYLQVFLRLIENDLFALFTHGRLSVLSALFALLVLFGHTFSLGSGEGPSLTHTYLEARLCVSAMKRVTMRAPRATAAVDTQTAARSPALSTMRPPMIAPPPIEMLNAALLRAVPASTRSPASALTSD